jgi:hypothetical protein
MAPRLWYVLCLKISCFPLGIRTPVIWIQDVLDNFGPIKTHYFLSKLLLQYIIIIIIIIISIIIIIIIYILLGTVLSL